jgi:nitrogen-specific signal transduction histidine kinase
MIFLKSGLVRPIVSKTLSPVDALESLRNARNATLIVEVKSALILAANAPAAHLFGFDPDDPPPRLSAHMLALERLRDIFRGTEFSTSRRQPLSFWTAKGEEIFDCYVDLITKAGNEATVLLSVPAVSVVHSAVDQTGPTMDDAATLREIAKQIREGSAALAAKHGAPDMAGPASKDVPPSIAPSETVSHEQGVTPSPTQHSSEAKISAAGHEGGKLEASDECQPKSGRASFDDDLARLAHELRTPISAIAAAAEIMRDERLGAIGNERYKSYASDIFDGAKHALSIIERLLPNAGAASREPLATSVQAVDLNEIARSAISAMLPLTEKADLQLSSDLQSDLPELVADPTALKQILLNLLTNSVKFSSPGGKISVRTWATSDGAISLAISDTGKGMTRREIAAALSPIRPRAAKPDHLGGMGIGLPLVRTLVEQFRGTLSINSAPGRGTEISIRFPRQKMIAV